MIVHMSQEESKPKDTSQTKQDDINTFHVTLTVAGVLVEDWHAPGAHLPPLLIAALIAAVSSVTPSPARRQILLSRGITLSELQSELHM